MADSYREPRNPVGISTGSDMPSVAENLGEATARRSGMSLLHSGHFTSSPRKFGGGTMWGTSQQVEQSFFTVFPGGA